LIDPAVFLNGEFLPLSEAKISVLDRGFIFGDGVYEVIPVYHKNLFRLTQHIERLENNLSAIQINNPYNREQWLERLTDVINRQGQENLSVYLQVTRGIAPRDHAFPKDIKPTVFIMASELKQISLQSFNNGSTVITLDDIRWQYCNIKSISLLPNILLKQQALDQNAQEAILIRDGEVTEGSSSNIFIVRDQVIKTPVKTRKLLPGVTRDLVVELARTASMQCEETTITEQELFEADEVWLTSSTREIVPVVKLNDQQVGDGSPGPVSRKMFDIYQMYKDSLRK
jgi:D-alanine transaminase